MVRPALHEQAIRVLVLLGIVSQTVMSCSYRHELAALGWSYTSLPPEAASKERGGQGHRAVWTTLVAYRAASSAWVRSARMSSACSSPTERRT